MLKNIKIGSDPELFLEKNGEIISAEGLIGGTKLEPKKISEEGHAIQEDNVMVEFNIPACVDVKSFVTNMNFVKNHLEILSKLQGCSLNYSASAELDQRFLETPQAKQFGCEPDFNVYSKSINSAPSSDTRLRTCGGHIHIGYDNPSQEVSEKIIYAMDAVLGLESINLDKDDRRKEMYGKAGSFRFKNYGVEYRSLSNFWIVNDKLMKWAFNKTMEAIELVNTGVINYIINNYSDDIEECINLNNKEKAIVLIAKIEKLKKELINL